MAFFRLDATIAIGAGSETNAVADLNGDGHLDLISAAYFDNKVVVLFGDGQGGFAAGTPLTGLAGASGLTVGDLDADGDVDLLIANLDADNIAIAINDGSGSFAVSTISSGPIPSGPEVGDFDNDGDLDFVVADYAQGTLYVMLNNGSGTFTPSVASPFPSGGTNPSEIASADFNGDGNLDLAVTNSGSNTATVFLGNGDGTFASPVAVATGSRPVGVDYGDVDADGDGDIVVANQIDGTLRVLFNDGAGQFLPGAPVFIGNYPYDVELGDLDADGDLDMVASRWNGDTVVALLNDGSGIFSTFSGGEIAISGTPGGVSLGDFDEDGDLDAATANFGAGNMSILFNAGSTYSVSSSSSDSEGLPRAAGQLQSPAVVRPVEEQLRRIRLRDG